MNEIKVTSTEDKVTIEIDKPVAEKLMGLLTGVHDVTGNPWDMTRLMNHIANQGITGREWIVDTSNTDFPQLRKFKRTS